MVVAMVERSNRPKVADDTAVLLARIGRGCGILAPLVSLGAIAIAMLLTPSFSWVGGALSDLGNPSAPAAWLFNSGLILGGLFAFPFAGWYASLAHNRVGQLTAVSMAGTALALIGTGVFPQSVPPHGLISLLFYALLTYTLVLDGSARALAGEVRAGLTWVWLGVAHVTGWVLLLIVGEFFGVSGQALPEAFGAMLLTGWFVISAWTGRSPEPRLRATGQDGDAEEP
jgi:hypothetical membrane protein